MQFAQMDSWASELGICPYTGQWEQIKNDMRWLPKTYAILVIPLSVTICSSLLFSYIVVFVLLGCVWLLPQHCLIYFVLSYEPMLQWKILHFIIRISLVLLLIFVSDFWLVRLRIPLSNHKILQDRSALDN